MTSQPDQKINAMHIYCPISHKEKAIIQWN